MAHRSHCCRAGSDAPSRTRARIAGRAGAGRGIGRHRLCRIGTFLDGDNRGSVCVENRRCGDGVGYKAGLLVSFDMVFSFSFSPFSRSHLHSASGSRLFQEAAAIGPGRALKRCTKTSTRHGTGAVVSVGLLGAGLRRGDAQNHGRDGGKECQRHRKLEGMHREVQVLITNVLVF